MSEVVGVFEGAGDWLGVNVGVTVKVLVGTSLGRSSGGCTTREVRNFSTIASRREDTCSRGQTAVNMGVISGWLKSTATETNSHGSRGSSAGLQLAK